MMPRLTRVFLRLSAAVAIAGLPAFAQGQSPAEGWLYGAGSSPFGQLGAHVSALATRRVTFPPDLFANVVAARTSQKHTLLVRADGVVWAMGQNDFGQLGPAATAAGDPAPVPGLPPVQAIAVGLDHSLALDEAGHVWAWGSNAKGQLGNGDPSVPVSVTPLAVAGLPAVKEIAAGQDFSLALTTEGEIWGWGDNAFLQLGAPGPGSSVPQRLPFPPYLVFSQISAGGRTALAVLANGPVWGWGSSTSGQLGGFGNFPVIQVASGARSVAVGEGHILIARLDGTVIARGLGLHGQLGNGSATTTTSFVPVSGLTGVSAVAAGTAHSLALREDGSIWSWGLNSSQQLGRKTQSTTAPIPGVATGLSLTARQIGAGGSGSVFVLDPPRIAASVSAPGTVSCGDVFDTSVTLRGYDTAGAVPVEIVLVLDESGSIDAPNFQKLRQFAANFVTAQHLAQGPNRVGVVMFDDTARILSPLTSNQAGLIDLINTTQQQGGQTCIGCALDAARTVLQSARPGTDRVMVVVTDGANNQQPNLLAQAIAAAHDVSTVFAIGVGSQVNPAEINAIASVLPGVKTAFFTPDFGALTVTLADLAIDVAPGARDVVLAADLGSAFELAGLPTVPTGSPVMAGSHVVWRIPQLGALPVTITLPLRGRGQGGMRVPFEALSYTVPFEAAVSIDAPAIAISSCPASVRLEPETAQRVVGETHTVVATLLDDFGAPITGRPGAYEFLVTVQGGPHSGRTGGGMDDRGQARLSYVGVLPGQDQIVALAAGQGLLGLNSPLVSVDWRLPNVAPTADAGPDQSLVLSGAPMAVFTLAGTATDDGQPQPVTLAWSEAGTPLGSGTNLALSRPVGTYSFTLTASDGELSGSDTVVVSIQDVSPPTIVPVITGPLGANGWYVGPIAIDWSVSDSESAVEGATGCNPSVLTTDTEGQTFTCKAKSAGGGAAASVTVKRDATPPVVTVPPGPVVEASGPSGATAKWSAPSASDALSGLLSLGCTAEPGDAFPVGETPVVCSAADAAGNMASASFEVTVRDTTPPTFSGVPANLSLAATTATGAVASWAPPTAVDRVSGPAAVACLPASGSVFAIGTTSVTCSAADAAGNAATASFTVTVTDEGEPGRMFGEGRVTAPNQHKVEFEFSVLETRRGVEWGRVRLEIKDGRRRGDEDRFEATSVDFVRFSNAPDYGPGRHSHTGVDTVVFTGTGRWERQRGYTYTVEASDRGEPGRGRDTFTIEVRAPNGQVVFSGGGTLADGNVQSTRLWRPWAWWGGGHRR